MKINKIQWRNGNQSKLITVNFHEKMTVIYTDVDVGKSAVLEAVAMLLGAYLRAFDDSCDYGISKLYPSKANISPHKISPLPTDLHVYGEGVLTETNTHWKATREVLRGKTGNVSGVSVKEAMELYHHGKSMQRAVRTRGMPVILPVISFYGSSRLWRKKSFGNEITNTSRMVGYTRTMKGSYGLLELWARQWVFFHHYEIIYNKPQTTDKIIESEVAGFLEAFNNAVEFCLKPHGIKKLEYWLPEEKMTVVDDEKNRKCLSKLDAKTRNKIIMVADIAFRAIKLNPHLGENACLQTTGVVLIDNMGLHLQKEEKNVFLGELTRSFPKMQFIVTSTNQNPVN